jgi:hypothetical protein
MILGWSPSKIVSGISYLRPRWLPPSKDYYTKVWLQLAQWFLRRRFLCEFPIGSFVKLSSAVAAILVGSLRCRTQFWKGTTQGSFQQILIEIGLVYRPCELLPSLFVRRPSVNISHFNLLLRNHWANCNQLWWNGPWVAHL